MKILIAGDFVPQDRVSAQIETGDYTCLERVISLLQMTDYSIVNLESPVVEHIAKPIDKSGPNLHCSEKAIECLKKTGFKCVTLANNHFRDQGQVGIDDTLEACRKYNIDYVGGGKDIIEAERILYKEINGQRLAIINVCENEWSIASEDYGGSNPLNPVRNYYDIINAKREADYVLIIIHGGIEAYRYPTPRMAETYRFFIDAGADAVINHHQHCYNGYEEYKGKPIFYGLGNFCLDRRNKRGNIWNEGYMVELSYDCEDVSYQVIPYSQCDENPVVELMIGEQKIAFENNVRRMNKIIEDPAALREQFEEKLKTLGKSRMSEFEPFSNKFVRLLQMWKVIPSLVSHGTYKNIFNIISCESHREIVLKAFDKYFDENGK